MLKTFVSSNLLSGDNNNEIVGGGRDRSFSKSKKSRNTKSGIQTRIKMTGEPIFLTSGATEAFNFVR